MKRIKFFIIIGVLLSAFTVTNCKKDSSGSSNSTPVMGVSVQGVNTSFNLPVSVAGLKATSATSLVKVTAASLLVSRLNFEAELKSSNKSHDSISIEYTWTGPQTVDLLNPTNEFGMFTLQSGFYNEVELRVTSERKISDTVPIFTLKGNFTDSLNVVTPITFTVNQGVVLATELKNDSITSSPGSAFSGVMQIYLDQLFVKVSATALKNAVKTNGTIVINSTTNKNLYSIIASNFLKRHHCEFFRRH